MRGRGGWGLGPWLRALARTEEERRAAVDARYRREVGAATARGWTATAEAIERERAQWVAEGAPL